MSASTGTRGPGAVRNEKARQAILTAASELIVRDGYERLTIGGIAARARVGKPTIYRWWSSKSALIAECLVDHALLPGTFAPRDSGDVVADISAWFDDVIGFISASENMALVRSLILAAVDNPDVAAQLGQRLGATPDSIEGRLRAAVAAGELEPGTPVEELTQTLLAVVIYRIISRQGFQPSDRDIFVPMLLAGSLDRTAARAD